MTAASKIKEYLQKEKVEYQVLEHKAAFTALEIAGAQHIPGRELVKSVIVSMDGHFIMCVLPAIYRIDFDRLKKVLGAHEIHLADEGQMAALFPNYEVGAEPPFALGMGIKIYADKILEENEDIVFNAGTHTDLIKMKLRDFIRLAKPTLASFGRHISEVQEQDDRYQKT